MWVFVRVMSNASAKIVATFFMVIVLMLAGLVLFPQQLNQLNDFANYIANQEWIRNPDIPEQGKFLFRTLVNESTIFGILMTLIARAIVEILFFLIGLMWRVANGQPVDPVDAAVLNRDETARGHLRVLTETNDQLSGKRQAWSVYTERHLVRHTVILS